MVIHHADGLHESITDGFTDKLEAFLFKEFTHGFGLLCRSWYVTHMLPLIDDWFAVHELPQRV